ncbi:MAG TPA: serine hydrolase domain-containing protein [Actinophytocola sp.]|uniref:serine hydrolase domain-containing protein n=1 Tax=Actinophytocola sp. TaxID=1872138 RepID=UPI002DDCBEC1|nr:serine hydrolase domain-containing protein [Actinophytocola sp.]HEV2778425.1 serine hydrolase domain-containing protein [Actinophytocola sp.]
MTVRSRRSTLGLLGTAPVAAGGLLAAAEPASAGRIPRDLLPDGRFDRFVARRAAADQFSGTVLLAHRGRPVLARSHGMANRDRAVANRPDTAFDLASVTKCLTAVAIGQLAQQGRVAFHEPLGTYLDGFPADVAQATVHQLLTHTSGVGRPALTTERPPDQFEWDTVDEVWNGTLAYLRTRPLRFTPGSRFDYSNDAYVVVGAIVAAVSGLSYYDYVRRHIFGPAGMTGADFFTKPQVLAAGGIAREYATQPAGDRADFVTTPFFPFIGSPAGGAFASAPDLLRFATALHGGKLLSPAFTHALTSGKVVVGSSPAVPATPGQIVFYGYGHVDGIVTHHRVVGHSGSGPGRANNLDVFLEEGWTVVILSNYDTGIRPIVDLAREIITRR